MVGAWQLACGWWVLTEVMNASLPEVPQPLKTTALWEGSHRSSHAHSITRSMVATVPLSYTPCVWCVWVIIHKGTQTSGVLAQSASLQAEECISLSSETCFICLHSTLIIQQMLCNTPQHTPTPIRLGAQPILVIGADVGVLCVFICVYSFVCTMAFCVSNS